MKVLHKQGTRIWEEKIQSLLQSLSQNLILFLSIIVCRALTLLQSNQRIGFVFGQYSLCSHCTICYFQLRFNQNIRYAFEVPQFYTSTTESPHINALICKTKPFNVFGHYSLCRPNIWFLHQHESTCKIDLIWEWNFTLISKTPLHQQRKNTSLAQSSSLL